MNLTGLIILTILPLCFSFNLFHQPVKKKLPNFKIKLENMAMCGMSSGAIQTVQYHYAYSSRIKRIGLFAGYPYSFAKDKKNPQIFNNLNKHKLKANEYIERVENYTKEGVIDHYKNLADSVVYVYHGSKDTVVAVEGGRVIVQMYRHFDAKVSPLTNVGKIPSDHAIPAKNFGGPCEFLNFPSYVNNCSYNGAYYMLRAIFEDDKIEEPHASSVGTVPLKGQLVEFDQSEFFNDDHFAGMDDIAFFYMPSGCKKKPHECRGAIVNHGCVQGRWEYGKRFMEESGFLEMAELNNIVLVFPQVKFNLEVLQMNPHGCWDFYGYTGPDFLLKSGAQLKALNGILDRMIGDDE